jgi:hypothetical protein
MASKAKKGGGHTIYKMDAAGYKKGAAWAQPLIDNWVKSEKGNKAKLDAYMKILADIRAGK